ncbi:helix-turn-helix domain-containing protein [Vibrio sp. STUT-A11]|uniref:helix-turn-helix domain-containing protein n=1 Tax=Vibrio sp. STUT-A11 TaxID=2976236 RepID=UPI00222F93B2|nr:helix-turn-helix domain-containing protein [Vibrio sp. STUT-A11]
MNDRELQRLTVIQDVLYCHLSRQDAPRILGISYRQLSRLIKSFLRFGAASLAHYNRGKPSPNRIDDKVKAQALKILSGIDDKVKAQALKILSERYPDFGPTFAHEKLTEQHHINVSLETLRQWMIADGLWVPHSQRKPRVYQPRYRRDCFG